MKPISSLFTTIFSAAVLSTMCACGGDTPQATIIEVNKKMPLIEWPDSAYIASLDEILAMEPIKKNAEEKPSIAMNTHEAPKFMLPSSVTGKKDSPKAKGKPGRGEKTQIANTKADNSAEVFMDKFAKALSALQSDPSNSGLYKVVEAKPGEDLFKLLRRTYGAGTQNLPRFYVLSTLQSVNPGVMLEHLNAGDKVRVPRI